MEHDTKFTTADNVLGGCMALAVVAIVIALIALCCGLSGDGGQWCDGRGGADPGSYCY